MSRRVNNLGRSKGGSHEDSVSFLMVAAAGVGFIGLIGVDFKSFAHARFEGHSSNLRAKIVFLDAGPSRTIMLQGVGCSVGSCSRHAIGGRAASDSLVNTSLDTIAAIKETRRR